MKKEIMKFLGVIAMVMVLTSCGGGGGDTDVVESGTYEGTIKEVEPSKTEIYVETSDNKTLELYFTEQTELTRGGQTVQFSELEEGQKVEVEVEKVGQRLDPVSVKILE